METRKLRHAVALARFMNFTRAAHDLNITQPALSRSIQALEAECRVQLFDRNRGMVTLTQAGRDFIRHAEALLRSEAALRDVVGQAAQGVGGRITVGVIPLAARVLLPQVLLQRIGQPHFHAEVVIGSSNQILAKLMQETIDLAVCVANPLLGRTPLATMVLAQLSLAVITRKDHPLTRFAAFGLRELEQFPLVRSASYSGDEVLPSFVGLTSSVPPAVTIEDFEVLRRLVTSSDAVWVTAPIAAKQEILNGELAQLPISWMQGTTVSLVACWLRQRTLSPIATSILEQFKADGAALM